MQVKKGILGYIVGTLSTLVTSLNLYLLFVALFKRIDLSSNFEFSFIDIPIEAFCGVAAVILCCGIFVLIIILKQQWALKRSPHFNEKALNIVSVVFFALVLMAFLALNIYCIKFRSANNFNYLSYTKVTDYFEGTGVTFDNFIEAQYFAILRFLLNVFGFFDNVMIYFNLCLCIVEITLISLSARLIFGTLTMPFISIGLSFVALLNDLIFDLSGILLWFLLVSIVVYITSYFCEMNKNKYPMTILLVFLAVVFFFKGMREIVFIPSAFLFNPSLNRLTDIYSSCDYFGIALTILSLYGCLSFYITKKNRIMLPEVVFLVEIFWILFDYSGYLNSYVTVMAQSLLAGMGMYILIYPIIVPKKIEVAEIAQVNEASREKEVKITHADEASTGKGPGNEKQVEIIEIKEENPHIEEINKETVIGSAEEIEENINPNPTIEKTENNTVGKPLVDRAADNKKPEIKFIDNPLPGPKKHVKKELKFAFEPLEKDMHFDLEIKDGDDFEL